MLASLAKGLHHSLMIGEAQTTHTYEQAMAVWGEGLAVAFKFSPDGQGVGGGQKWSVGTLDP